MSTNDELLDAALLEPFAGGWNREFDGVVRFRDCHDEHWYELLARIEDTELHLSVSWGQPGFAMDVVVDTGDIPREIAWHLSRYVRAVRTVLRDEEGE